MARVSSNSYLARVVSGRTPETGGAGNGAKTVGPAGPQADGGGMAGEDGGNRRQRYAHVGGRSEELPRRKLRIKAHVA